MTGPTLQDVLAVVRQRPGCPTYVYRNMLDTAGHRDLGTPTVLRRLRRLEVLGRVRRARTGYAVMLAWELAEGAPHA